MADKLDAIHHLAISVKNIGESVDYYQKTFECKVVYQDATWALLQFANIQLALVLPGHHPPHLAIAKDDAENWGKLTKHRDGVESVYIADNAGNSIEILKTSTLRQTY